MTCTSDANSPAVIFQWLCNGTPLSNGTRSITLSEAIPESETLTSSEVAIRSLLSEDPCDYKCEAASRYGSCSAVFNSTFSPPPYKIVITGRRLSHYSPSNASVAVINRQPHDITCEAHGARPPAVLEWHIPDDVTVVLQDQSDVVRGNSYVSWKGATITPSRNDQGKSLRCVASHPQLQNNLQRSVHLNVQGPPDDVKMTTTNDLRDEIETNVSCKAVNGYPAPLIHWYIGSRNVTHDSSLKTSVTVDDRFDAESILTLKPKRIDNGKPLLCQIVQPATPSMRSVNEIMVLNISYSPIIVNIYVRRLEHEKRFISIEFICSSDANPPAMNFYWSHNKTILTNTSRRLILSGRVQIKTISTSRLVIHDVQPSYSGKYECLVATDLGNATATLNYSIIPDPPSRLFVDRNQTTSSTLFVAWQPGFDGGIQTTFTLEYCPNDTQVDGCGVLTNLKGTSVTLVGLNPFTWYWMTLSAVNIAGNSSAVETIASTAPLQPESYGINTSWNKQKYVLTLPNANHYHNELCFIKLRTYIGPDCASVNRTECVEPGTEVSIDPDDDTVLVTFGRELCSKPANLTGSPVEKQQIDDSGLPFMTIALGVIASAVFILLISLGFIYFYGVLCCVKRKKDNGKHNQPEGRTVDQGEYAEIAQVPPSHASKSTTSHYMDLKPIPRTDNDTTTSQYMDLKPNPRTNNDTTTSHYMDLKPISRTNNDTTTSHYMDLKPIPRTNNDTTTSYYMDMKPSPRTGNDEYVSPRVIRKEFEAVYVNTDMTDENPLQNDRDNQD